MPAKAERAQFTLHPLLWMSLSFALGIVAANVWELPLGLFIGVAAACAVGAVLPIEKLPASLLVLGAFLALGAICYNVEFLSISTDRLSRMYDDGRLVSGDPLEIEGTVIGVPEAASDGYFVTLAAEEIRSQDSELSASGKLRLFAPTPTMEANADYAELDIRHGTRIRIACRPEREERFINPGVISRIELLDRQGIDATATVKSPLLIEKLGRESVFLPLAFVYERRANLIDSIREQFEPSTVGVLIASMLGDKHFLDRQTADAFREGGTFHVLVISGLHITFIGGLILLVARRFTRRRTLQAFVAVSALWLYGIAVGGEAPVVRACVMFSLMMVGYAFYRTSTLLNALGGGALVLLVWRPTELLDPSFQLTFVSIAAIVVLGLPLIENLESIGTWTPTSARPFPPNVPSWLRRFCETIYWREAAWEIERGRQIWSAQLFKAPFVNRIDDLGFRRVLTFVFEGVVISLAVQIWLLPLLVYYFHRLSIVSVFLNLWVGPVLAIESVSALIAVALSSLSHILALPFETLTEAFNSILIAGPSIITAGDWASIRIPIYSGELKLIYGLYFVPVIAVSIMILGWDPFTLRRKGKRFITYIAPASILLFSALIIFHPFSAPEPDGNLHVDFLDVGQGDAALITFPNGETMLVDGGGRQEYRSDSEDAEPFEPDVPRIGEAVVSEFLWERGLARIDHVVATHADADHIQGLTDVTQNFRIGTAYFGRLQDDPALRELLNLWHEQRIPVKEIAAEDVLETGGVRIEVLNPIPGSRENVSSNNGSLVLRLIYGETEILLTGDIERLAEESLLASGKQLFADVVKVPHHGSRTSSTEAFVRAVSPSFAIIPVGRRSVFGHPHREVVERWKASGSTVITTGEKGTVNVKTDGKNLSVSQYLK